MHGFGLGAVYFVTKPFQRQELLARLRTHLEVDRLRNHLEEMDERICELKENLLVFVKAIAATIEMRNLYTLVEICRRSLHVNMADIELA